MSDKDKRICGTCKYYVSWQDDYEDPLEPWDFGYCDLYERAEKCVAYDDEACDKYEPFEK